MERSWGAEIWENKSVEQSPESVVGGLVLGRPSALQKEQARVRRFLDAHVFSRWDRPLTVLDAGVGPMARFTEVFVERGHSVTALDASSTTIEKAQERLGPDRSAAVTWVEGDFTSFDVDDRFDLVFCYASFYHLPAHLAMIALERFVAHTTDDGVVLVDFSVKDSVRLRDLAFELAYFTGKRVAAPIVERRVKTFEVTVTSNTTAEIEDMADRLGLVVEHRDGSLFLFRRRSPSSE